MTARGKKPGAAKKPKKPKAKKKPTGKDTPPEQEALRLIPGVTAGGREGEILPPRGPAVDAKEFLIAIMNTDPLKLQLMGVYQEPTLSQRIVAAQTVLPFTHRRQPVDIIHKQAASWTDKIQSAQDRMAKLRRTVEAGDTGHDTAEAGA